MPCGAHLVKFLRGLAIGLVLSITAGLMLALPSAHVSRTEAAKAQLAPTVGIKDPSWPVTSSPLACRAPEWASAPPSEDFRRVLVVGDSLTQGSMPVLARMLSRKGWLPTVRCWAGKDVAWGLSQLRRARQIGQMPDHVVVALGTNDVFAGRSLLSAARRVQRTVGLSAKVWWVNLHLDSSVPGVPSSAAANAQLRRARTNWPTLRIVDFNRAMRSRARDPRVYLTDGVHLSKRGYTLRSALIARALGVPPAP